MKKWANLSCFILFLFTTNNSIGQEYFINHQVNVLKILEVDSLIQKNKIAKRKMFIEKKDSLKILLEETIYDEYGYIKQWSRFDSTESEIHIIVKYERLSDSVVKSKIILDCDKLHSIKDAKHIAYEFKSFHRYCKNVKSKYSLITRVNYNLNLDTGLVVNSMIEKKNVYSYSQLYPSRQFLNKQIPAKPLPGDTLSVSDSIILVNRYLEEDGKSLLVKRYFLPSRVEPVKVENAEYENDSLVNYILIEDSVDLQGRIFWHKKYYGLEKTLWESERTIFNDETGMTTVERDVNPSDGIPDMIWVRDRQKKMIKYSRLLGLKKDKFEVFYFYNDQGLLIQKLECINGIKTYNEFYEYELR